MGDMGNAKGGGSEAGGGARRAVCSGSGSACVYEQRTRSRAMCVCGAGVVRKWLMGRALAIMGRFYSEIGLAATQRRFP